MSKKTPSHLDGYRAAEIIIAQYLDTYKELVPKRSRKKHTKTKAYTQGYFDGLVFAHCQLALGSFPEHNKEEIFMALKSIKPFLDILNKH